ncbi:MAG: protein kinase [Pirellulales bacterium]|nr:protein kinase [Pirellulales bacterium]
MAPTNPEKDDLYIQKLAELDECLHRGKTEAEEEIFRSCDPELAQRLAHTAVLLRALNSLSAGQSATRHPATVNSPPPEPYLAEEETDWPTLNTPRAQNILPDLLSFQPRTLGRFVIERELGRGGHGIVYLAQDRQIQRHVAIKVPRLESLLDENLRNRFELEAQAAGSLSHPNIVAVYEVDLTLPVCFIVTEYVAGPSLVNWSKSQRHRSPRVAAQIIAQLADGVQHAHVRGVIHRDIKPSNVLLAPHRESAGFSADPIPATDLKFVPKLADFGLAKLTEADQKTRTGTILGTPAYMSPEQMRGEIRQIGIASDIYALGVLLYELCAGEIPFAGANDPDTVRRVLQGQPVPLRTVNPAVSRDLQTICHKCLEHEPTRRYATAAALADDLNSYLAGRPITARPVSWTEKAVRWCLANSVLAASLMITFLVLNVATVGWLWYRDRLDDATAARKAGEYYTHLSRAREQMQERSFGWSQPVEQELHAAANLDVPNRKATELRSIIAEMSLRPDMREIATVGQGVVAYSLAFSADGNQLAIGPNHTDVGLAITVQIWDLTSQPPTKRDVTFPIDFDFQTRSGKPDGVRSLLFDSVKNRLFAGARSGQIHVWDLSVYPATRISWLAHSQNVNSLFLTSSDRLLSGAEPGELAIWDINTQSALTRHELIGKTLPLAWHPGWGKLIAGTERGAYMVDPDTLAVETLYIPQNRIVSYPAIPPNGEIYSIGLGYGGSLPVYDSHTRGLLGTFVDRNLTTGSKPHEHIFESLKYLNSSNFIISSSSDQRCKIWDVAAQDMVNQILLSGDAHLQTAIDPVGNRLALAQERQTKIYQIENNLTWNALAHQPEFLCRFAVAADSQELITLRTPRETNGNSVLSSWNWQTGRKTREIFCTASFHATKVRVFQPQKQEDIWYGEGIISRFPNQNHAWTLDFLVNHFNTFVADSDGSCYVAWMRDGKNGNRPDVIQRISADGPRVICEWSTAIAGTTPKFLGEIYEMCIGGSRLAASHGSRIHIFNKENLQHQRTIAVAADTIEPLCWLPDYRRLVAGTQKGHVLLVDGIDGRILHDLDISSDKITSVACTSNGQLIAVGTIDKFIHFFGVAGDRLELLWKLPVNKSVIQLDFFNHNQGLAILLNGENAIRLLNLKRLNEKFAEFDLNPSIQIIGSPDHASESSTPLAPPPSDPYLNKLSPVLRTDFPKLDYPNLCRHVSDWAPTQGYSIAIPLYNLAFDDTDQSITALAFRADAAVAREIPLGELPPILDTAEINDSGEFLRRALKWGLSQPEPCYAIPNHHLGLDKNQQTLFGAVFLKLSAGEIRRIDTTDYPEIRRKNFFVRLPALQEYARQHGYLAAYPTYGEEETPDDRRVEVLFFKQGAGDIVEIPQPTSNVAK